MIDPNRNKEAYLRWRHATDGLIGGANTESARLLRQFLDDMEAGRNVGRGARKGGRGYARLNTLRHRLAMLARVLDERYAVSRVATVSEEQIHALFRDMRNGGITTQRGDTYRSTGDYVNAFRTFWHWHMRVQRKFGVVVDDICVDLDDSTEKPPWVYLTEEDVRTLCDHAKHEYRVLLGFLFDTGIRSPTELVNVRVEDLLEGATKLRIREATSKTFGRTINLMRCPDLLRAHIKEKRLVPGDQLFQISPPVVNRYLRRLAARVLGDGRTLGGARYSELTMYDFRHSSACYWLPRYKSENALKYRFGWKRSEMIHYYTQFLGMQDTITEEDLCTAPERSAIEQRLMQTEQEKRLLAEQVASLQGEMQQILAVVQQLTKKVGQRLEHAASETYPMDRASE
ncbi:MAG TPA: site-specific integrase [Thermoanaerobaculales bacterium]|nr:site-specific integrase [Thermoanaerobaculales bacterium]